MNNIELVIINENNIDYNLIHNWCLKEYVYDYFEQRKLSYNEIYNKYKNKLLDKKQTLLYIKYNNKIIGLIQYYKSDYNYLNDYNIYEYDLFIGDKKYLSKGIGFIVINKLNDYLFSNYNINYIVLRPFKRNTRACKCYEKCGFTLIEEYSSKDTIGNKEIISVYLKSR